MNPYIPVLEDLIASDIAEAAFSGLPDLTTSSDSDLPEPNAAASRSQQIQYTGWQEGKFRRNFVNQKESKFWKNRETEKQKDIIRIIKI